MWNCARDLYWHFWDLPRSLAILHESINYNSDRDTRRFGRRLKIDCSICQICTFSFSNINIIFVWHRLQCCCCKPSTEPHIMCLNRQCHKRVWEKKSESPQSHRVTFINPLTHVQRSDSAAVSSMWKWQQPRSIWKHTKRHRRESRQNCGEGKITS